MPLCSLFLLLVAHCQVLAKHGVRKRCQQILECLQSKNLAQICYKHWTGSSLSWHRTVKLCTSRKQHPHTLDSVKLNSLEIPFLTIFMDMIKMKWHGFYHYIRITIRRVPLIQTNPKVQTRHSAQQH